MKACVRQRTEHFSEPTTVTRGDEGRLDRKRRLHPVDEPLLTANAHRTANRLTSASEKVLLLHGGVHAQCDARHW